MCLIYFQAENTPSYVVYVEAERKSTLYTKVFLYGLLLYLGIAVHCLSISNVRYNIFVLNNSDWSSYFFPYNFFIPFTPRNHFRGFVIHFLFGVYGGFVYIISLTTTLTFFIGACFYIEASVQELRQAFVNIDTAALRAIKHVDLHVKTHHCIVFHIKIMESVNCIDCIGQRENSTFLFFWFS